ncbi:kinase-like domain-containing protein [Cladochytrium replicatum]|nr:kinase-like domain-containing protein [Cladochytrium replicatum]
MYLPPSAPNRPPIELIDLTTPEPETLHATKRRRRDDDYGPEAVYNDAYGAGGTSRKQNGRQQQPPYPQHPLSLQGYSTRSAVSAQQSYVPPSQPIVPAQTRIPPVIESNATAEPCDDKEGHYIVNVNDNLTPRFKIMRLLGQGTFGKVVEAYDRYNGTMVAIKIIRSIQKYRDASKIEIKMISPLTALSSRRCIHLKECFDHRNHICMVFELLSTSVFDFLKDNGFNPFPQWQIRSMAHQILDAVHFLHVDLRLIHTDLKPENLMLESAQYRLAASKRAPSKTRKELLSTQIRLIDFGSAIFENDYHSAVVSTRHYRAPEIILGMGWSFPCDIWSIGCILVEFFTGDALFQTHDNLEHLAMMDAVLGSFPQHIVVRAATHRTASKFFRDGKLDYPNGTTAKSSKRFVRSMKPLRELIPPVDDVSKLFVDLVERMLVYDPTLRITAKDALAHPFFKIAMPEDGLGVGGVESVRRRLRGGA